MVSLIHNSATPEIEVDPETYEGFGEMVDTMVALRKGKMSADAAQAAGARLIAVVAVRVPERGQLRQKQAAL